MASLVVRGASDGIWEHVIGARTTVGELLEERTVIRITARRHVVKNCFVLSLVFNYCSRGFP